MQAPGCDADDVAWLLVPVRSWQILLMHLMGQELGEVSASAEQRLPDLGTATH